MTGRQLSDPTGGGVMEPQPELFATVDVARTGGLAPLIDLGAFTISSAGSLLAAWFGAPARAVGEEVPTSWARGFLALVSLAPITLVYLTLRRCEDLPHLILVLVASAAVFAVAQLAIFQLHGNLRQPGTPAKRRSILQVIDWLTLIVVMAGAVIAFSAVVSGIILSAYNRQHEAISARAETYELHPNQFTTIRLGGRACCNPPQYEKLPPEDGVIDPGGTYTAPARIARPRSIIIKVATPSYLDGNTFASILLLPEAVGIDRYTSRVTMPDGRVGLADLIVLKKDDSWEFGSEDRLTGGRLLATALGTPDLRRLLGSYDKIVAVGTASREGDDNDEFGRAHTRAGMIAATLCDLRSAGNRTQKIVRLNLGRFKAPEGSKVSPVQSATERRVIIFGLIGDSLSADPLSAIKAAVKQKSRGGDDQIFKLIDAFYPADKWELVNGC